MGGTGETVTLADVEQGGDQTVDRVLHELKVLPL